MTNPWLCKQCGSPIEYGLSCQACNTTITAEEIDLDNDAIAAEWGMRMLFQMKRQRAELNKMGLGEKIQTPQSTKTCTVCTTSNSTNANYCKNCGNKF